ncbi:MULTISPECIES: hypothetical protein [unclassified Mesorhizobium]|nr:MULTISPECIES: hypothetical protein [unclassified Mesorhizobium]
MGYSPDESLVGQYALSFKEDPAVRRSYQPLFGDVRLGPFVEEPGSAPRP